jgi:glycosyltransferase A (GT-A) superfamily protein (DUF2064 family)
MLILEFDSRSSKSSVKEFEERLGQIKGPRGAKAELIRAAIAGFSGDFTMIQLGHACPGVSRDMTDWFFADCKRNVKQSASAVVLGPLGGEGVIPPRKGNKEGNKTTANAFLLNKYALSLNKLCGYLTIIR